MQRATQKKTIPTHTLIPVRKHVIKECREERRQSEREERRVSNLHVYEDHVIPHVGMKGHGRKTHFVCVANVN